MTSRKDAMPAISQETDDGRLFSPSTERNRDVVRDVFLGEVAANARVLELASGSGQHCVHILKSAPKMTWIASDISNASLRSAAAWVKFEGVETQVEAVRELDASAQDWAIEGELDAILSCNMIHISPWNVGLGLFAGAGRYLAPKGKLVLYGPFKRNGEHTAQSNFDFDVSLKSRDASWGIRDLEEDVIPAAMQAGLTLSSIHAMPANNFSVVFERALTS
ncbi:DUF938 domain-containing protein [Hirschia litorea]|uniref:DUF938 domain-containing protein n=1 Tax=Hirschia litorea TaxID=1199156 RepID=A0ABW2IJE8_9PROT